MEGDDGGAVHGLPTYPLPPGSTPGLSGSQPIQYPPGFIGPMSPMRVRSGSKAAPCSPSVGVRISDNQSDTPSCSPSELSPLAPPCFPPNQSAKLQVTPGSSTLSTAMAPCSVNCTPQMGYSRCGTLLSDIVTSAVDFCRLHRTRVVDLKTYNRNWLLDYVVDFCYAWDSRIEHTALRSRAHRIACRHNQCTSSAYLLDFTHPWAGPS